MVEYRKWKAGIDLIREQGVNDNFLVTIDLGEGQMTYSPLPYWAKMRLILFLLYAHTFWNMGSPIRKLRFRLNV